MLYLMAFSGFLIGGSDFVYALRFEFFAQSAVMKSSDPALVRAAKYMPNEPMRADVIYETAKGAIAVPKKRLSGAQVQTLARGEGIALKFFEDDPDFAWYEDEERPSGIGWLGFGFAALALSVYAHRLLRKELAGG
jgi:hypothetical protein